MSYDPRVDEYIAKAEDFAKPVLVHIRKLVHEACPDVKETMKWSFPHFDYKGIMCGVASFKKHCAFGFWKASLMDDPGKVLQVSDRNAMGHFDRITSLDDLPSDLAIKSLVLEAMRLNDEGVKVPKPKKEKIALVIPGEFQSLLDNNPGAKEVFENFPYSHKKEYLMWFAEAKTMPTKASRMAQAIEWIGEGKGRNWKYEMKK